MITAELVKSHLDYKNFYSEELGTLRPGSNGNALALCPFHPDKKPSLSVNLLNGLWNCFGCGAKGDVFAFYMKRHGYDFSTALRDLARLAGLDPDAARPGEKDRGLTLEQFAAAKKLPVDFLQAYGVREVRGKDGQPYLVFEYRDLNGKPIPEAARLRFSLAEKPRAKRGGRPMIYGLEEIPQMLAEDGELILGEGETDRLTGRYYALPIMTLPGKNNTGLLDPVTLKGFRTIYVWQEPGAEDFPVNVARALPGFKVLRIIPPEGIKDLSEANIRGLDVPDLVHRMQREGLEVGVGTGKSEVGDIITVSQLLSQKYEVDDEIIGGGILPVGGGLIMAGESGDGKSLLRLELAIHIALGTDWGGLRIPKQRRVMIIQVENTHRQEAYRLRRMLLGRGLSHHAIEDRLLFSNPTLRFNLAKSSDVLKLNQIIRDSQAEVVIYDPLTSFHNTNENDNVAIRTMLDTITAINRELNVTAIIIHHFGKPTENTSNAYRTRGASSIKDWADTLMILTRKKHEYKTLRLLEFVKVRNGPQPKPIMLERDEFFLHWPIVDNVICPPEKVAEIIRDRGGSVEGFGKLKVIIASEVGCSVRSAASYIKTAINLGFVSCHEHPDHKQKRIYAA